MVATMFPNLMVADQVDQVAWTNLHWEQLEEPGKGLTFPLECFGDLP